MRVNLISYSLVMMLTASGFASASFVGDLKLTPPGCEKSGLCTLETEFGYVDPSGIGWMAKAGLLTDGASIPPWAQPIVGKPFETAFIKAAIIHDHYCDRHVRPWRQTHRVFYDALVESGLPKSKAGVMYFAILVGGPKWVKLIKGKPCPLGYSCINDAQIGASLPGTGISIGEANEIYLARSANFDSATFANMMSDKLPVLEQYGDALNVELVESEAAKAMAGDLFFSNGDEIGGDMGTEAPIK